MLNLIMPTFTVPIVASKSEMCRYDWCRSAESRGVFADKVMTDHRC
jgi:hypothetical protein